MKRVLLLLFFPCLLSAQIVDKKAIKKDLLIYQFSNKSEDKTNLRSGSTNLPDSIYTYYGLRKDLIRVSALTYDDKGRKTQESGWFDSNGDGIIGDNDTEFRKVYTYNENNDTLWTEEVHSILSDGRWTDLDKIVSVIKMPDLQLDYCIYEKNYDEWFLWSRTVATEFNEKGLPIVYRDSTFDEYSCEEMRIEVTYDEYDLYDVWTTFVHRDDLAAIGYEWAAYEKMDISYNMQRKLDKVLYYSYDWYNDNWSYSYMTENTYDDPGNIISEIETSANGFITEALYYTNIYSSFTANDPVISVESSIRPNPVSDVLYVSIDGATPAEITLVSLSGNVVYRQHVMQSSISIPVDSLAKGNYFLLVQTVSGIQTHKVVIK